MADRVYMEPLTLPFLKKIIRKERPDALLPSLGGQTGLNMAMELHKDGILSEFHVEVLGTDLKAIEKAEDREAFRSLMREIGEPVPPSFITQDVAGALRFAEEIGYPVIVRPAFTMGGTGGGIAKDKAELKAIVENGLSLSPVGQCLIEMSIAGWKEIEFEVMRDESDTAIVVCSMENVDPVGIHTGDSIVCGTGSDPDGQGGADAPRCIPQDHPGTGYPGRLQRAAGAGSQELPVFHHRSQSESVQVFRPGVQSHGITPSPRWHRRLPWDTDSMNL